MTAGEWIQIGVAIVLTLTLGGVLWYACETRKMAQEVKSSRQDAARPVLDIQEESLLDRRPEPIEAISEALEEEWKDSVWCPLRNIGKGPALNIKAQIKGDIGALEDVLGTLGIGDEGERRRFMIIKANG